MGTQAGARGLVTHEQIMVVVAAGGRGHVPGRVLVSTTSVRLNWAQSPLSMPSHLLSNPAAVSQSAPVSPALCQGRTMEPR